MTTVINLAGMKDRFGTALENAPSDLDYVGRATYWGGWRLPGSVYFNPYKVGGLRTREQAVTMYGRLLLRTPLMLADTVTFRDRTLACWCAPELCHGHLLAYLAEQHDPEAALRDWIDSGRGGAVLLNAEPTFL